jgi:hypothetical protein
MSEVTVTAPAVYGLLATLRKEVGNLKAKKKEGVKFKVRSAEDLNDKIRGVALDLGLLIYPVKAQGQAFVVEDGTMASVNLTLRIQAVSDQSYIDVESFGLGADNQDKAGGKANTYAWKSALIQTLLAGGAEDTDDTDTPIKGGVRAKTGKVKVTPADVQAALDKVTDQDGFNAALALARNLSMDEQKGIADSFKAARARITPQATGGN